MWYRPSAVDSVRRDGDARGGDRSRVQSHFCDEKNPEHAKYTPNVAGYDVFGQPFNRQNAASFKTAKRSRIAATANGCRIKSGQAARSFGGRRIGRHVAERRAVESQDAVLSQQNDLRASVTKSLDDLANITLEHSKQLKELSELANGPCRVVDGGEVNVNTEADDNAGRASKIEADFRRYLVRWRFA